MGRTIAAVSTAMASGPVGIVRISGEDAFSIVDQVFRPERGKPLSKRDRHKLIYGSLLDRHGLLLDQCLACVMEGPHSYTGEDMAEIQCHGSMTVINAALSAVFSAGAVQAEPGEFTKRAFLNGRLDLSGAEAVHDMVTAQTVQAARNAAAQLTGAVGNRIRDIRERLVTLAATFYAYVDYPDEEIDLSLFEHAEEILQQTTGELYALAESYEKGKVAKEGIACAILGKPNVGKSSLLNALTGEDSAIVTAIAGTTRDIVEETIRLGPVLLRVSDTAGLRDTEDAVEKIGIERAIRRADRASLILAVFDGSAPLSYEDKMVVARTEGKRAIAVWNKCDLPAAADEDFLRRHFQKIVKISAKNGDNLQVLTQTICEMAGLSDVAFDGSLITNARQAAALTRAARRCEEAFFSAQSGMTADAVVMDTEGAIAALGEITGQTVTDDIVQKIFEQFCVGK